MVKRLNYKLLSRTLEIISDNPAYDRAEIPIDEFEQNSIKIIGRVMVGIKKM
jgi:phage repressor protein C with HTH and peptisase S24 domain